MHHEEQLIVFWRGWSEDSLIAASATRSYPEECLAHVQHEVHHQPGTSAGSPAADEVTEEPEIEPANRLQNSGYITCRSWRRRQSDTVDKKIGASSHASSKQWCINCWFAKQSSVQSMQRVIKTDDSPDGQRGMFRVVRDLSLNSMSLLPEVLDRRDRLLYLWHMLGSTEFTREDLWRFPISWSESILQRFQQCDMCRHSQLNKGWDEDFGTHTLTNFNCTRRSFIPRYLGRKTKVWKGLEIVLKKSRTSRTNEVKTRLSRSSTKD